MEFSDKLKGIVALVAGASRGPGCGTACTPGEAGATVYCTGRRLRGQPCDKHRPETIEDTAEMITTRGGIGIFVRVDHASQKPVNALFESKSEEQQSKLAREYGLYHLYGTQSMGCN